MTIAPAPGTDLEHWNEDDWSEFGDLGMEDIRPGELAVPRMEILGRDGKFRDRNTKMEYLKLDAVILGVVKQRTMWDSKVDDGDRPQCRSTDFELGFPQMHTDIPARKQFPWSKGNFDPANFQPGEDGLIELPCDSCIFKDWNTALGDKPMCQELYTFPLLYDDGDGGFSPAIVTFKGAGAKACKQYISFFKGKKQPMFTVRTEISLEVDSRGTVTYSKPVFKRGEPTKSEHWREMGDQYRGIREFLRQRPRSLEEDDAAKTRKPMASAVEATAIAEDDPWAGVPEPAIPVSAPAIPAPRAAGVPPMVPPNEPPKRTRELPF